MSFIDAALTTGLTITLHVVIIVLLPLHSLLLTVLFDLYCGARAAMCVCVYACVCARACVYVCV